LIRFVTLHNQYEQKEPGKEHSQSSLQTAIGQYCSEMQIDSGGEFCILGGDIIGHCKKKSSCKHVYRKERIRNVTIRKQIGLEEPFKKELNRTNLHGTAMFKEWQKEDYPKQHRSGCRNKRQHEEDQRKTGWKV